MLMSGMILWSLGTENKFSSQFRFWEPSEMSEGVPGIGKLQSGEV